ncbi:hypothetical protein RRG08_040656 [Elysia crispata]|uniref:Uncharacterized protein n=1 Tax=Elysia crispata TaxID=231223 RepID=A0AAE0YZH2_9GAST|nr:hypothetical protein RRG08_040656 [Elysia crispata]
MNLECSQFNNGQAPTARAPPKHLDTLPSRGWGRVSGLSSSPMVHHSFLNINHSISRVQRRPSLLSQDQSWYSLLLSVLTLTPQVPDTDSTEYLWILRRKNKIKNRIPSRLCMSPQS